MFKIPTYDELEKKESEFNKERQTYTSKHFQKRKKLASVDSIEENTEGTEINKDLAPKIQTTLPINKKISIEANKSILLESNENNDEDDDDDLLNFIADNKDIISGTSKNDFAVPAIPIKPTAPVPTKFDPNMPILRVPVQQGSSSTSAGQSSSGGGSLIVNAKQRGNLVLKHIRNVQWRFCDQITPDYQMSKLMCGFFLSMKYHLLNPTYIHKRIKEMGRAYNVRVLLALVDVKEPRHCIKELEKISIYSNLSLVLCWSNEEVARYLETFKAYEFKSAETIMEKATVTVLGQQGTINFNSSDTNFVNSITDFLCQIKSINKTDASTLRQTYGSIKQLSQSSKDELNLCPGLGPLKVNRLHEIFKVPFLLSKK